jgi:NADPH:quinone reductase-like Zn-dependent oxidoreductase
MKKLLTSLAVSALTVTAIGLSTPADAAPAGPSSVDATIEQLQARGLDVIVNRVGTAPLDQCTINAVRPGQLYSRSDSGSGNPGSWNDIVTTVTGNTVYVDLVC